MTTIVSEKTTVFYSLFKHPPTVASREHVIVTAKGKLEWKAGTETSKVTKVLNEAIAMLQGEKSKDYQKKSKKLCQRIKKKIPKKKRAQIIEEITTFLEALKPKKQKGRGSNSNIYARYRRPTTRPRAMTTQLFSGAFIPPTISAVKQDKKKPSPIDLRNQEVVQAIIQAYPEKENVTTSMRSQMLKEVGVALKLSQTILKATYHNQQHDFTIATYDAKVWVVRDMGWRVDKGSLKTVTTGLDFCTGKKVAVLNSRKFDNAIEAMRKEIAFYDKFNGGPNITPLIGSLETEDGIKMIQPLLEGNGKKLIETILQSNPFGTNPTLLFYQQASLAVDLLRAIAFIHEAGYVLYDLKPENLLFQLEDDQLYHFYLTDFGGAKKAEEKNDDSLTTLLYTPPEQYDVNSPKCKTKTVSQTAMQSRRKKWDVWAVGLILHQLLLGDVTSHPYNSEEKKISELSGYQAMSYLNSLQRIKIEPNLSQLPKTSEPFTGIIRQCVEPYPELRPDSQTLLDKALSILKQAKQQYEQTQKKR